MADSCSINSINDPWHQYGNVIGIPSRRRIICGIIWIFLILALVGIAFLVMVNQCCPKTQRSKLYTAFHSATNFSIDPCVDFYEFSCGLWAQRHPLQEGEAKVTSFSILQRDVEKKERTIFENTDVSADLPNLVNYAIQFFNVCVEQYGMKNDNSKVLIEHLNRIGGWPILNKSAWNDDLFDWFNASAYLIKYLGIHTVIGVYGIEDDKNAGENIIYLKPPNLIKDFSERLNYSDFPIFDILCKLEKTYKYNLEEIRNLEQSESRWLELFYSSRESSEPLHISIEELNQQIPEINWLSYLQMIMNDTLLEINETITLNDVVQVENLGYLKRVASIMTTSKYFSKLELANLFGWFTVRDINILIPGFCEQFKKDVDSEYSKKIVMDSCYKLITESFPCSLEFLFVKNATPSVVGESKIITSYVKSAFTDILQNSGWLDEISKEYILHKLDSMIDILGFPSYMFNKTEMEIMYANFPPITSNILEYYFQIQHYYTNLTTLSVKLPVNRRKMFLPRRVTHVSAYYMQNKNMFVLPISLYSPPFFYTHGPSYLNFGAIGSVVAHEIMHGFDQCDFGFENLTNESSVKFKQRTKCFEDRYSSFGMSSAGRFKNLTLRENIADNEGVRIAFDAYKKYVSHFGIEKQYQSFQNCTPDQMFFISFATVYCSNFNPDMPRKIYSHSPPEVRVNGVVSNSKYFSAAFDCPVGSSMNPEKKCTLW